VLTLPYILINSFIVRLIIAKQIQRIAFFWQVFQSMGNILVLWLMISVFGYMGYPIGGLAASYIYILLLMYFLLKDQFGFIDNVALIRYFIFNILIILPISFGFTALGLEAQASQSLVRKILSICWTSALFLLIYIFAGYFIGINRDIIKNIIYKIRAVLKSKLSLMF
jgi:peptidoglycan biosynthesis protein MviN/MurJ (putative lipid II flippase)